MQSNLTLRHAIHYASLGIPVLPLHYMTNQGICSCGGPTVNTKCKPGKHPYGKLVPHGVNDASTDFTILKEWFDGQPYGLGIATGNVSRFFALDRDDKDDGDKTLTAWEQENSTLPKTMTQRTGNGMHYLFKIPAGIEIRNMQKKIDAPGLDVRGDGGYICAAPTMHYSGRQYKWTDSELMDFSKIANAPAWLIDKIKTPTSPLQKKKSKIADPVLGINNAFTLPSLVHDGQGRESTLLSYAAQMRAHGVEQTEIETALLTYNATKILPPLDEVTVLDRARRYQLQQPLSAKNTQPCTDTGNARRLFDYASKLGVHIRYIHERKAWLIWNPAEHCWTWDTKCAIVELAKGMAIAIYDEAKVAAAAGDSVRAGALSTHAGRSAMLQKLNAAIILAQSLPQVASSVAELDSDDWLAACSNGVTVNLHTGVARDSALDDLITMRLGVAYDSSADCPEFKKFISWAMGNDVAMVQFLQMVFGVSLSGVRSFQAFLYLFGHGLNGKTTLVNVMREILGDYSVVTQPETFMATKNSGGSDPTPDRAKLMGRRLVTATEIEDGQRLSESFIKQVTGGDPVAARFLHGNPFEFTPKFLLVMAANHLPIIQGTDFGIWRRVWLVPFNQVVATPDSELPDKLRHEYSGILNWMLDGLRQWKANGQSIKLPAGVVNATMQFREIGRAHV